MNLNEQNHGFRTVRTKPIRELDAELYELEHVRTGLKLAWLKRAEENKTFAIAFETLPWNDTGVFHILEHSVLCGSDRYPVKEPFVELLKSSMNTFLNAMTFPDKTMYPISSRSAQDFLNLTRVYLDAVFRPAIYTKPEIFRQEGWHYAFDDEGNPSYRGVVFNEMKGAMADADSLSEVAMNRLLFPDTPYRWVSGGDPACIPTLTCEEFLESHRRFYSPSNAYVFLDGDLELDAVLSLLEEYLADAEPRERLAPPAIQQSVDGGTETLFYELPDGEDAEGKTRLLWGRVLGTFAEQEKCTAMQVLSTVLCGNNQSPLCRAILSEGLAQDVSLSVQDETAQLWVRLEVKNLDERNLPRVEQVVTDTLRSLAENGLDRTQLEAALANQEFRERERDFGAYPKGIIFAMQVMASWLYGGAPEELLEVGDVYDRLRAKLDEGYFEQLIREVLLENPHRCRLILTPSATLGEERRAAEQARLAKASSSWTEETRAALLREEQALEAWQSSEDTPEALATLPHLTLADLPQEPERLPLRETTLTGLPVLLHELNAGGITYVTLYFDVAGRSGEELSALTLLCSTLGKTATRSHTAEELTNRIRLLCGRMSFYPDVYGRENDPAACTVKLCVSFSALRQNVAAAAELAAEILTETVFSSEKEVLDVLRQTRLVLFQQIIMSGHSLAVGRVSAQTNAAAAATEHLGGYACYVWLKEQEDGWSWEPMRERLAALLRETVGKRTLTVSVTGEHTAEAETACARLAALLPEEGAAYTPSAPVAPFGVHREGIILPADIAFAARGGELTAHGSGHSGAMTLASHILGLSYLWNVIRVQGGAYGTGLLVRDNGGAYCYSYRDPNAARSLEQYTGCADFLRTFCAEQPDLTGFIIGAVSDASPLLTPRLRGQVSDSLYWRGFTWERRCALRRELLEATPERLLALADSLEATIAEGGVCVAGSRVQLEQCGLTELLPL